MLFRVLGRKHHSLLSDVHFFVLGTMKFGRWFTSSVTYSGKTAIIFSRKLYLHCGMYLWRNRSRYGNNAEGYCLRICSKISSNGELSNHLKVKYWVYCRSAWYEHDMEIYWHSWWPVFGEISTDHSRHNTRQLDYRLVWKKWENYK